MIANLAKLSIGAPTRPLDPGDGSDDPEEKRRKADESPEPPQYPFIQIVESDEEQEEEEDQEDQQEQYAKCDSDNDSGCYGQPREDYEYDTEEDEEEKGNDGAESVDSEATLVGNARKADDDETVDDLEDHATADPPGGTEDGDATEMDEEEDAGGDDGGDDGGDGDFVPNVPPARRVVMVLDIRDSERTRTINSRSYDAEFYYEFTDETVGSYMPLVTRSAFNSIMQSIIDLDLSAGNVREYFSTRSQPFYPPFPECIVPNLRRLDVSFVVEYGERTGAYELITQNVEERGMTFMQFLMGEYHDGIPDGCMAAPVRPVPVAPDLPDSIPDDFLPDDPDPSSDLVPLQPGSPEREPGSPEVGPEYDIDVQPFNAPPNATYTDLPGFSFPLFQPLNGKWSTTKTRGFVMKKQTQNAQWVDIVNRLGQYVRMCTMRINYFKKEIKKLAVTKRNIRAARSPYTMEDAFYYAEQYKPLLEDIEVHISNCMWFVKQAIVLSPICAFMVRIDDMGAAMAADCRKNFHVQWTQLRKNIDEFGTVLDLLVTTTKASKEDTNFPLKDLYLSQRAHRNDYTFMQRKNGGAIWQYSVRGPTTFIEFQAQMEFIMQYIQEYLHQRYGPLHATIAPNAQAEINSSEGYKAARWWLNNWKETDEELVVRGP
jgi:hypothetical protein